jgi:hypothetical protein
MNVLRCRRRGLGWWAGSGDAASTSLWRSRAAIPGRPAPLTRPTTPSHPVGVVAFMDDARSTASVLPAPGTPVPAVVPLPERVVTNPRAGVTSNATANAGGGEGAHFGARTSVSVRSCDLGLVGYRGAEKALRGRWPPSGRCAARDGRARAHKDVLVAFPKGANGRARPPATRMQGVSTQRASLRTFPTRPAPAACRAGSGSE